MMSAAITPICSGIIAPYRRDLHVRFATLWLLGLSLLFSLWPEIDLWLARLVVTAEGAFLPKKMQPFYSLYIAVPWGIGFSLTILGGLWLYGLYRRRPVAGVRTREMLFVVGGLMLGPGLIVNSLLKAHWGRPRPVQLSEFGGWADFTAAWDFSHECVENCSFASGHAAGAFYLLAYGFLWRKPALFALGTGWGLLAGGVRILQGGHFLSDVLIAGAITYWVYALLAVWLLPPQTHH